MVKDFADRTGLDCLYNALIINILNSQNSFTEIVLKQILSKSSNPRQIPKLRPKVLVQPHQHKCNVVCRILKSIINNSSDILFISYHKGDFIKTCAITILHMNVKSFFICRRVYS